MFPSEWIKPILYSIAARIGTAETWNARIATEQEGMRTVVVMEGWFALAFREKNPKALARFEFPRWRYRVHTILPSRSGLAASRGADFLCELRGAFRLGPSQYRG